VDLTDCWMPTSQAQLGCKTGYTAQKALNWFAIFNSEDGWKRWGENTLKLYMGDFKHLNVGRGSAWVSQTCGSVQMTKLCGPLSLWYAWDGWLSD
jgi:hypothetical protein